MNLTKSSSKILISKVGSSIISFLGIAYFAQTLGASVLGVYFLFEAVLGVLSIFADLGLRDAIEKRVSGGRGSDILTTGILLKFILLLIVIIPMLLAHPYLNDFFGAQIAVLLTVTLITREFAEIMLRVVQAELRVGETAILRFSRVVVWVSLGAVLVHLGFEIRSIIYSTIVGNIFVFVWGNYKRTLSFGTPNYELIQSLFDFSKYSFILSSGGYIYSWIDVILIGFFLTQAEVGAYETAWRITALLGLVSLSIETTIFPQVSNWFSEDNRQKIEQMIPNAITASLIVTIPAFFGVLAFSEQILAHLFGAEFTIASFALIILSGEKTIQSIQRIVGRSLQGIDRPDFAAISTTLAIILNLGLNAFLIPRFGINGAAVATSVSFGLDAVFQWYLLSQEIRLRFPFRELLECSAASLGMLAVLLLSKSYIVISNAPELLAMVSFGVITYLCLIFLVPNLRAHIFQLRTELLSTHK